MKKYKLILDDEGGCDYSIHCGTLVIDIEAENMDDAKSKVISLLIYDYGYDDDIKNGNDDIEKKFTSIKIIEVTESDQIDVKEFYDSIKSGARVNKKKMEEAEEKQQYEKLKSKFESDKQGS